MSYYRVDVVIQRGDRVTRDQQVSPRLDIRILDVDAAFDSSASGLDTNCGEDLESGLSGLELEHAEVSTSEDTNVWYSRVATLTVLG